MRDSFLPSFSLEYWLWRRISSGTVSYGSLDVGDGYDGMRIGRIFLIGICERPVARARLAWRAASFRLPTTPISALQASCVARSSWQSARRRAFQLQVQMTSSRSDETRASMSTEAFGITDKVERVSAHPGQDAPTMACVSCGPRE